MAEYRKTLSTQAFDKLSQKSAESLQSMLKGKSFMQASMDSMRLLQEVMSIETPYRTELETIAEIAIKEAFPIIKEMNIKIDAKIEDPGGMSINQQEKQEDIDLEDIARKRGLDKRRIINSITQGASIRGTKAYYFFRELIDDLDNTLVEKYNQLLDDAYGIYDDDNAIAMMLAMMSQNTGRQGGEAEAEWNHETGELKIIARAVCFPILVHEIVKGLYEIISTQGFSKDAESNKAIAQSVDKAQNEPEDLRYGKFIYDAINTLLTKYKPGEDISPVREYFFAEVYKLEDEDFIDFIDNLLAERLTKSQRNWVEETIKNL